MAGKTNWVKEYGALIIGLLAFLLTAATMIYGAGMLRGDLDHATEENKKQNEKLDALQTTATQNTEAAKQNAKTAAELNRAVDSLGGLVHRLQVDQAEQSAEQRTLIRQNKEILDDLKDELRRPR
jgi:hypothetical protein